MSSTSLKVSKLIAMAISPIRTVSVLLVVSFLISSSSSVDPFDAFFVSPTPPPQPQSSAADHSLYSILPPVLSHLGFLDLASAVPSLSADSSVAWNGPSTVFAPSDASLRTCFSCSVTNLLREHIVPGLFTADYLGKLAFGTKIETLSPGRCITLTSNNIQRSNYTVASASKLFVGGVAVTHPDLFNNGMVVVHGIQGYISPLSPLSCDVEKMTSLSFPAFPDRSHQQHAQPAIMRLMLREAMLRLRNNGFSLLALAMKVKYAELISLSNMTMFALDDLSIFTDSPGYIHNVRFHIIPNQLLTMRDLERLPEGTVLPTLESGQNLVITTAGGGDVTPPQMRINYVRVKVPDLMRNLRIVVHSVFLPFPHISQPATPDDLVDSNIGKETSPEVDRLSPPVEGGACTAVDANGDCALAAVNSGVDQQMAPVTPIKATAEIEDHHGL